MQLKLSVNRSPVWSPGFSRQNVHTTVRFWMVEKPHRLKPGLHTLPLTDSINRTRPNALSREEQGRPQKARSGTYRIAKYEHYDVARQRGRDQNTAGGCENGLPVV